MKVDYHIHSHHSDGIYTIEEIISLLKEKQITTFAISDHDTIAGVKKAKQLAKSEFNFHTGIEFTCKEHYFPTLQKSYSLHLLGYDFDEENEELKNRLERRKKEVQEVFSTLCKELTKKGYPVKVDEVFIHCGNVLQLSDISAHIQKHYPACSKDIYEFIESYAQKLTSVNISIEEAIHLLHHANGKAIWAHPFHIYHNFHKQVIEKQEVKEIISSLLSLKIDGIEAIYSAFDKDEQTWLIELASHHTLCYTAGSDFHGSNGRNHLGMQISSLIQL